METNDKLMTVVAVAIIGAGPAGLATAACLRAKHFIHNFVIFEKEDCCASLWRRRAYDRLRLHLGKRYCALPYKPHSGKASNFLSKDDFINYIDEYVSHFKIKPRYSHRVTKASYEEDIGLWKIDVFNATTEKTIRYLARFLVVATGENNDPYIPRYLSGFAGAVHSSEYKSGEMYRGMDVLVVGAGNSGFEISYDLANHGARASIVVRSPVHVVSRNMVEVAMWLLRYIPVWIVDLFVTFAARLKFGDLSRYGIVRPSKGPFHLKLKTGRSPTIDVGTVDQIKKGNIKVFPAISKVEGKVVEFIDGTRTAFDAMIFSTGYKSSACQWLQSYGCILNDNGLPKEDPPLVWKGGNGIYCVGFSSRGLPGISQDALNVAADIDLQLSETEDET